MNTESLGVLLYRIEKNFRQALDAELRKLRLTTDEFIVLMDLYHQKKIGSDQSRTVSIIATRVSMETDYMEELITKMEKADWVVRIYDQVDRRREDIFLSSKAMSVIDYIVQIYQYVETKAYAGFSEEEIEQIQNLVKRMDENLS